MDNLKWVVKSAGKRGSIFDNMFVTKDYIFATNSNAIHVIKNSLSLKEGCYDKTTLEYISSLDGYIPTNLLDKTLSIKDVLYDETKPFDLKKNPKKYVFGRITGLYINKHRYDASLYNKAMAILTMSKQKPAISYGQSDDGVLFIGNNDSFAIVCPLI